MPRSITHECDLCPAGSVLADFFAQLAPIRSKVGPVLIQLPPAQNYQRKTASKFLSSVRKEWTGRLALEPRNASWFTSDADKVLCDFTVARAAADPARHPGAGQPGGDTSLAYYRLHGSPRMYYSDYGEEYLARLAANIQQGGAKETWVIFDNTAYSHALGNALRLMELTGLR